jgi:hypothetical protein
MAAKGVRVFMRSLNKLLPWAGHHVTAEDLARRPLPWGFVTPAQIGLVRAARAALDAHWGGASPQADEGEEWVYEDGSQISHPALRELFKELRHDFREGAQAAYRRVGVLFTSQADFLMHDVTSADLSGESDVGPCQSLWLMIDEIPSSRGQCS